jgi:hypothetical protein
MKASRNSQTDEDYGTKPNLFKKTKLCSFFQVDSCRYGDHCQYAHGEAEIEAVLDLRKTTICVAWTSRTCLLTKAACPFAHGKKDLRQITLPHKRADTKESRQIVQPQTGKLPTSAMQIDPCASISSQALRGDRPSASVITEPMKVKLFSSSDDWKYFYLSPFPFTQSYAWDADMSVNTDSDSRSDASELAQLQSPLPIMLPLPHFTK